MRKEFVESQKKKLQEQRNEILASIESRSEQVSRLIDNAEPGDDADMASDTIDRNLLNQLGTQDSRRLNMIKSALDRIEQGKYGICLMCGNEIPEARLESLPYAALCVSCQSKEERRNRG